MTIRTVGVWAILIATSPAYAGDPCLRQVGLEAALDVVPGMEGLLPPRVNDGDSFTATVVYAPSDGPVSHGEFVCNYKSRRWELVLGPNVYGRRRSDGLGSIGTGGIQLRNDDPVYHDRFAFGASYSSGSPPHAEFKLFFSLVDLDSTVWETVCGLPDVIPFESFEEVVVEVSRIVPDGAGGYERVTVATGVDPRFTLVPIEQLDDFTGDCVVDGQDIAVLFDHWGETDGPYDLNEDGVVNFPDLLRMLMYWYWGF